MEIRRQKLEAMRNQLSDDSPRERSKGHHNSSQGESRNQPYKNEMRMGVDEGTNDCDKIDGEMKASKEMPLNVAMETIDICRQENRSSMGREFGKNLENVQSSEMDNRNTSDIHVKEACCKGVDVTSLRRMCEHATIHGSTSAALLHSKQPDIVKSVLPRHHIEPISPVAPPRRRKKKHAPLPPLIRHDFNVSARIFSVHFISAKLTKTLKAI